MAYNRLGLYAALGIARNEKDKMRTRHRRNFLFFDAPVEMIFSIDRDLPVCSCFDGVMLLKNIMIAARGFGLDTCPQQAFAAYHALILEVPDLPENRVVICGMALGVADKIDPANRFGTEREPLEQFASIHK